MTKDEIYQFLNANPVCFLATVDGDRPRVRGMMLYRTDENGLVFHSGTGKDLNEQLHQNPAVEICAFSQAANTQVRVSGTAEFVDDLDLKKEIVAARPFLQGIIEKIGYEHLLVFRVTGCQATVWTMESNLAPKTYVDL